MSYIGRAAANPNSPRVVFEFVAQSTGGVTLSGTDDFGRTLSYTPGQVNVTVAGAVLDSTQFSAANGSSVSVASVLAGQRIRVEAMGVQGTFSQILASASTLDVSGALTAASAVVSANSSTPALRVTQVGTGHALLVEDSANPDSTPFVVDAAGKVGVGTSSPLYQLHGVQSGASVAVGLTAYGSGLNPSLVFERARGTSAAPLAADGTANLGAIIFRGHDGTAMMDSSFIMASQSGAISAGNVASDIGFYKALPNNGGISELMRLTAGGNLGVGTSAPIDLLHVFKASGAASMRIQNDATAIGNFASLNLNTKNGAFSVGVEAGATPRFYVFNNAAGSDQIQISGGANSSVGLIATGTGAMTLSAGGFERARLSSAGNLGIGDTPVDAFGRNIRLSAGAGAASATLLFQPVNVNDQRLYLLNNASAPAGAFASESFVYNQTAGNCSATMYEQVAGYHIWKTAPAGAAGNAITFTESMRIDPNGNVAVGGDAIYGRFTLIPKTDPTSPATANQLCIGESTRNGGFRLQVGYMNVAGGFAGSIQSYHAGAPGTLVVQGEGGNVGVGTSAPVAKLHIAGTNRTLSLAGLASGEGNASYFLMGNSDSAGAAGPTVMLSANRSLQFGVGSSFTANNGGTFTEYMRLEDGKLGIGLTAVEKLQVNGNVGTVGDGIGLRVLNAAQNGGGRVTANAGNAGGITIGGDAGPVVICGGAGGAERMRTTTGGLCFGQTGLGWSNSNSQTLESTGYGVFNHATGSANGTSYLHFGYGAAGIGSITQSGTTGVLYNTTSDRRLKDNIQDAAAAGDIVDAIRVVSFNWKAEGNDAVSHGFIAQELHEVFPGAVKTGDTDEEISDAWAVDPSKLVALLVAEVQDLRKRLAALEATK
jgi:hypothetical protein